MPETTALALPVIDHGASTAIQVAQERTKMILEVMANVLEEGKDYGTIPGTPKPTLFKSGAEKLLLTFNLAAGEPKVEELSTADAVRYRVSVPIESVQGLPRWGIGEASTDEEKYRWKRPVCEAEWDETPEHLRREKWRRHGGALHQDQQIRTSPADVANTILKMGHKRALIHGTLLATGASSVFNQDLEDFSREMRESLLEGDAPRASPPTSTRSRERHAVAGSVKPPAADDANLLVTPPRKVQDVKLFGKNQDNFALKLVGDSQEYTTKNATLANELGRFKGTDHVIVVRYNDNPYTFADGRQKVYHNIAGYELADDLPPAPSSSGPLTADEIPF